MQKTLIGAIVAIIIVGGISFYAGMSYAKSQTPSRGTGAGQFANRAGGFAGRGGANGGVTAGDIISKDASSISIKMQDGSTKLVLFGTSTQVVKAVSGTLSDLSSGTNVVVTGSANSDGSLTAQNIQIRPAGMQGGFGGPRTQ